VKFSASRETIRLDLRGAGLPAVVPRQIAPTGTVRTAGRAWTYARRILDGFGHMIEQPHLYATAERLTDSCVSANLSLSCIPRALRMVDNCGGRSPGKHAHCSR
jgi:hypothetical protein